jgi:hypothetical protein
LADTFFPRVGFATAAVLERFGADVRVPLSQTCCGQPAFNSGNRKEARKMARKFLSSFAGKGYIVTPSGSCAAMVKNEYSALFRDEPEMLSLASLAGERIYELSQFLVEVLGVLDAAALGGEIEKAHQPEFQLEGTKVPWDGDPRDVPAIWRITHGPIPSLGRLGTGLSPARRLLAGIALSILVYTCLIYFRLRLPRIRSGKQTAPGGGSVPRRPHLLWTD